MESRRSGDAQTAGLNTIVVLRDLAMRRRRDIRYPLAEHRGIDIGSGDRTWSRTCKGQWEHIWGVDAVMAVSDVGLDFLVTRVISWAEEELPSSVECSNIHIQFMK